jgi:hypothetical protein
MYRAGIFRRGGGRNQRREPTADQDSQTDHRASKNHHSLFLANAWPYPDFR